MSSLPPSLIDAQILSTLELLHYCRRFQSQVFGFIFQRHTDFEQVVIDSRVLQAAGIKQVIVCPADKSLIAALEKWNRSGDRFVIIEVTQGDLGGNQLSLRIQRELDSGCAPFVAVRDMPQDFETSYSFQAQLVRFLVELDCRKVFFPSDQPGLLIDGFLKSYPNLSQIRESLRAGAKFNIPSERVEFFIQQQELYEIDLVLVPARRGAIYEEVFTHAGSGTLLTKEYPNILRAANEGDVRDIMAIMQPYVAEGALTPVSEEWLLSVIQTFMVYSVNDQIVCAASLKNYGQSVELAKLCTLPRFQAKGRARALVQALIHEATRQGKSDIFALTVQPYVGEFFERLGFKPVDRELLPDEWKSGYDLSRPSRAYRRVLKV